MNVKIACCYHYTSPKVIDPVVLKYPDVFIPVVGGSAIVGRADDPFFNAMRHDNEGENISLFNGLLSEATSLFWLYKHLEEFNSPDMVGLCHYRRVFDLDYNRLDEHTIYLKRCGCPIPEHHTFLGSYWSDPEIAVLVRDEYFNTFPQYFSLYQTLKEDYTFYDKEMFVMNRREFYHYMDYMMRCIRLILNRILPRILKWYSELPTTYGAQFLCYNRGFSYHLECFAALYFAMLQEQGYRIQVTNLTEGSVHDDYGHMCVPRRC